jgi:hypothetical protein
VEDCHNFEDRLKALESEVTDLKADRRRLWTLLRTAGALFGQGFIEREHDAAVLDS